MPKISMWNPKKGNDYNFIDKAIGENIQIGGVGVLIHKYAGAGESSDISKIDDILFLENRERNYEDTVYEARCDYTPQDIDFNLSQFGIFLSSDTMQFDFHSNTIIEIIGRKLISGDVLEFPSMRDTSLSGESINKYYVVQDALFSAAGYSQTWYPHLWKVKAKIMTASSEFNDILAKAALGDSAGGIGNGMGLMPPEYLNSLNENGNYSLELANTLNLYCKYLNITDEIVKEAEKDVFYDPKFMITPHLYICIDNNGYPTLNNWHSGDGIPPNGAPLKGMGIAFPDDMIDGEYFLRVDYTPDRLFQKQGSCFVRIEDDLRKVWTAYNRRLDSYIDNVNITTLDDGTKILEKQALSKVIPAKIDLYADNKITLGDIEQERQHIAKTQNGADEC